MIRRLYSRIKVTEKKPEIKARVCKDLWPSGYTNKYYHLRGKMMEHNGARTFDSAKNELFKTI